MEQKLFPQENYQFGLDCIVSYLESNGIVQSPAIYFLSVRDEAFKLISGSSETKLSLSSGKESDNILTATKEECTLAFIKGKKSKELDSQYKEYIKVLLKLYFEKKFESDYLENIRKPIDFINKPHEFFLSSARLISHTIKMPMIAIRHLTKDGDLETLASYDTNNSIRRFCDFIAGDTPEPFMDVIKETQTLIEENRIEEIRPKFHYNIDKSDMKYRFLYENNNDLADVKFFIVFPVVCGFKLFGLIGCAARTRFIFSSVLESYVTSLMQAIEVSINNFLAYSELSALKNLQLEAMVDANAIEIAKSAKHRLSNSHGQIAAYFVFLSKCIKKSKHANHNLVEEALKNVDESINQLQPIIRNLEFGNSNRAHNLNQSDINSIWKDAVELAQGRLTNKKIETSYKISKRCPGTFYIGLLTDVFFNLILNSIDAFDEMKQKKSGHMISLYLQEETSSRYILRYTDNGPGLNKNKSLYYIPEHQHNILDTDHNIGNEKFDIKELIFLPKVSSKKSPGSGWGLYLVRQALRAHDASIDLISYANNGCTFEIDLPKNQST